MRLVVDNVVQQAMAGKVLNLSSLVVMLSLAFRGGIWGLAETFLSVPLMVVIMIVCAEVPSLRPIAAIMSSDGKLPKQAHGRMGILDRESVVTSVAVKRCFR